MSKLRVYEVAKDLGLENKALVALFQSVGVADVRNHMSVVGAESVERVKRQLEKQHSAEKTVEERIRPTVVKRRAARPAAGLEVEAPSQVSPAARSAEASVVRPAVVVRRPAAEAVRTAAVPPAAPPAPVQVQPVTPPPVASKVEAAAPVEGAAPVKVAAPAVAPKSEGISEAAVEARPAPVVAEPAPAVPVADVRKPVVKEGTAPAPAAKAAVEVPAQAAAAPAVPAVAAPAPAVAAVAAPAVPAVAAPVAAAATAPSAKPAAVEPRPTTPPKTGIDVWQGRPGVPMPQVHRPSGPVARRVQYDAKAGNVGGRPRGNAPLLGGGGMSSGAPMGGGGGGSRGPGGAGARGGGMRQRGLGSLGRGKGMGQAVTQERSAHKKVVRVEESVLLQTLAGKMQIKATEVLMKLMRLGMTGVNINSTLDAETAKIVANEFGWEVEDVTVTEEDAIVAAQGIETQKEAGGTVVRPPVVTVMGHVDHGKTSLLDKIRQAEVAAGEAGGITQHIGAYSVETNHGTITFLDTPGHEAFTAMRARGAQATDIVILVVAADDGVMPQTLEAISHARAAKVPIVVAVNKCDKPDAQPERVRRELSDVGLLPEEWGGDTLFAEVSAMTGAGVSALLDQVSLLAEMLEFKGSPDKPASGVVIEAQLDRGRGPVATVLVTDGTLRQGDVILAGGAYGKARAMLSSSRVPLLEAGPSTPIEIIGLNDVPSAGDLVHVIRDMKTAQQLAESRKTKDRRSLAPGSGPRMSLEELAKAMSETERLDLKVIIKADVQGSVGALTEAIQKLATPKVKVSVVHAGAGSITEGDVNLAIASGAIIIGFNVRPAGKAASLAQQEKIEIRQYSIIYNVVDDIRAAMEGLLAPTLVEKLIGRAEVRQTFRISKSGTVAGCMVVDGVIKRAAGLRLMREKLVIFTGKCSHLKRFKDDAREVKEGFECGISLDGFNDIKDGDIIEAFEMEEVKQTL